MRGLALDPGDWPPVVVAYARGVAECLRRLTDLAAAGALVSPLTGIAPRDETETRQALKSIVMSYIHMSNNRLAVTPMHEYRFAQMLMWAARDAAIEEAAGLHAVAAAR